MNSKDRTGQCVSGGDWSKAEEPDLAWCAAGAVALVTGIKVGGHGPCRGAGVAAEQFGSVSRGRTLELDYAFGVCQQVDAPGRVWRATIVGHGRKQPVRVVDQYQRLGARQPGLRTGRRDQPHLVDSDRAEPTVGPRDQHLVDTGCQVQEEPVAGRTHGRALDQRFIEPQPPPANWTFSPKGHASTVPNTRYAYEMFENPSPVTSAPLHTAARVYSGRHLQPYLESLSGVSNWLNSSVFPAEARGRLGVSEDWG